MNIAEITGPYAEHPLADHDDPRWAQVDAWAAELGMSGPNAVSRSSDSPEDAAARAETERHQAVTAPAPDVSRPSRQFLDALPDLTRIESELGKALLPAMTQGSDDSRGFANTAWMLAKALRFLLEAAAPDDPADLDAALAEVDASTMIAAGHARSLRAAAGDPGALAAATESARQADWDLGGCLVTSATARTLAGDEDDEIRISLDDTGQVNWHSQARGPLPVDGRTQLDLAAVLDALGAACERAVPRPSAAPGEDM
jgi:hypothetical protein